MDNQYKHESAKAQDALADLRERGSDAIGGTWKEFKAELLEEGRLTPEDMIASKLRVAMMIELSRARAVKQPTPTKTTREATKSTGEKAARIAP